MSVIISKKRIEKGDTDALLRVLDDQAVVSPDDAEVIWGGKAPAGSPFARELRASGAVGGFRTPDAFVWWVGEDYRGRGVYMMTAVWVTKSGVDIKEPWEMQYKPRFTRRRPITSVGPVRVRTHLRRP